MISLPLWLRFMLEPLLTRQGFENFPASNWCAGQSVMQWHFCRAALSLITPRRRAVALCTRTREQLPNLFAEWSKQLHGKGVWYQRYVLTLLSSLASWHFIDCTTQCTCNLPGIRKCGGFLGLFQARRHECRDFEEESCGFLKNEMP